MTEFGYSLSSEEFGPRELVRFAEAAEDAGFPFALISDHFHPWTDSQGHSPFVWNVLGAIAQRTRKLVLGTGVTCPIMRTHPAIVAQAAATASLMLEGRFFLGVGSGEALNEHIVGQHWPPADVRLEMLEEAVEILRMLWNGGKQSHYGQYFKMENARIYDLPARTLPVYFAAAGEASTKLAGRRGDGLICTEASRDTVQKFRTAGGAGKPIYGQLTVCWDDNETDAIETAFKAWASGAVRGELKQDLPTPQHFEQASKMVTRDSLAESVICGPDPERHVRALRKYVEAGCTHVYVHQIGPRQEEFMRFYQREVIPALETAASRA